MVSTWWDIIRCIENRFGTTFPNVSPLAGPPGDIRIDNTHQEGVILGGNGSPSLSFLDSLAFLANIPVPMSLNDESSSLSFYDGDSPFTGNLASISPHPALLLDMSEEEDASNFLLEFSSDGAASPALSNAQYPTIPAPATGVSFRRHSVGEAGAPLARATGSRTKRRVTDDDDYVPSVDVSGEVSDEDVDNSLVSNVRASKHRRSVTTPTSAPACLTVPLPHSEHARDDTDNASINSDKISTTTTQQRRRAGNRRAGAARRVKRTPCEFCTKTFSRMQDAQRHMATTCTANPDKTGVECPECHSVLSRLDAAQRHWRGHENPTCEPPAWAQRA